MDLNMPATIRNTCSAAAHIYVHRKILKGRKCRKGRRSRERKRRQTDADADAKAEGACRRHEHTRARQPGQMTDDEQMRRHGGPVSQSSKKAVLSLPPPRRRRALIARPRSNSAHTRGAASSRLRLRLLTRTRQKAGGGQRYETKETRGKRQEARGKSV